MQNFASHDTVDPATFAREHLFGVLSDLRRQGTVIGERENRITINGEWSARTTPTRPHGNRGGCVSRPLADAGQFLEETPAYGETGDTARRTA